jgi:chemotaxis-related protein WspD
MSDALINVTSSGQTCWSQIGVWGDSTCPELPRVLHCRNCEVYTSSGRRLLDRPIPDDYLDFWNTLLAQEQLTALTASTAYLVFRIGKLWLAFHATSLREITESRVIRRVPHRPHEVLRGLVNVRGELYPCVSLHTIFGEESSADSARGARFLVARWANEDWVFPVDQVEGMHDVSEDHIEPVPATLSNTEVVYTSGLFRWNEKTVAIIDENLLFGSLVRRIA